MHSKGKIVIFIYTYIIFVLVLFFLLIGALGMYCGNVFSYCCCGFKLQSCCCCRFKLRSCCCEFKLLPSHVTLIKLGSKFLYGYRRSCVFVSKSCEPNGKFWFRLLKLGNCVEILIGFSLSVSIPSFETSSSDSIAL